MANVNLGTIEALLKLRDEMSPALRTVSAGVEGLRGKLDSVLKGFTFAAGVKAAVEFGKAVGDLARRAEELGNLSKRTGLAVESIQQLQRVAANAGGSFEQISTAVKFLQKNLVDGSAAFAALGLKVSDLMKMRPEEQLQKTAQAIASIQSPAERTAAAMAVFGKSGADMLPLLDQLARGSSGLALSLSGEQVAALQALDDQLDMASGGLADLRDQFLAALAASPAVVNAIALIAQAIRGIAEAVRDATPQIQAFVSTTLGMVANAGAKLAAFADEMQRGHGLTAALDAAAGATFNLQTATTATANTLAEMTPEYQKQIALAKDAAKAEESRAAAVKKSAEEQAKFSALVKAQISDRMIEEMAAGPKPSRLGLERMGVADLLDKAKASAKDLSASLGPGLAKDIDFSKLQGFGLPDQAVTKFAFAGKTAADAFAEMAQKMRDAKAPAQDIGDALRGVGASAEEAAAAIASTTKSIGLMDSLKSGLKGLPQVILGAIQGGGDVSKAAGASIFSKMFAEDSALTKSITGGLSKVLGSGIGDALGSIIPGLGTMLGSALGGLLSKGLSKVGDFLGIGGNKQIMEVNKLRDSFLSAQGGFEAFSKKMASVSKEDWAKKIFNAKTVEDFNRLVREAQDLLDTQGQAQEALNAAVEKYGFTVDELGPKFRQQELDTMAGELLQDYELLKASGIDLNLIHEKMAPNMSEYIQTAIKAGTSVPEAMRPVIEAMITNGQLLDENGQAYASAEAAGITFAQTMSEQFSTLIQKIGDLVAALTGIPNVDRTVTVTTHQNAGAGETGDYGGVPEDYRAASGFHATVSRPTRILVGEAGPERVDVTPGGGAGGGGWGGGGITLNATYSVDPTQTGEGQSRLMRIQNQQHLRDLRADPLIRRYIEKGPRG